MVAICREMGITLMKTSYSTIFNEGLDFTCALRRRARRHDRGAPISARRTIGGMPLLIQSCVARAPNQNDRGRRRHRPQRSLSRRAAHAGAHLLQADLRRRRADGLRGLASATSSEIGGLVPGSFASEATEIFHEGLRVPPVKIKKRGEDEDEVWKLLLANVRTPRENYGDYRALISAVDLGEQAPRSRSSGNTARRLSRSACDDLLDYSEARMRAELAAFPDGHYDFEDCMENDGIDDRALQDRRRRRTSRATRSSSTSLGSDKQARGAINATLGVRLVGQLQRHPALHRSVDPEELRLLPADQGDRAAGLRGERRLSRPLRSAATRRRIRASPTP